MATRAKKKRAARLGLSTGRRKSAVAAYRRTGVFARVAECLGVSERRLRDWRAKDPEFDAEMKAAADELTYEVGELARKVAHRHFLDVLEGKRVVRESQALTRTGDVVDLVESEPVAPNVGMVRTALTKLDRTWTHPDTKQEVTVRTVGDALDALGDE